MKNFFNFTKKSILGMFLAILSLFTFNYSSLYVIGTKLSEISLTSTSAYTSSTTQSYYATANSTESNISSGNYPSELEEYFSNSSNNFNIQTYYDTRFSALFAGYVSNFFNDIETVLSNSNLSIFIDSDVLQKFEEEEYDYAKELQLFIETSGGVYDTIYDYYTDNSSTINSQGRGTTFQEFIEYILSNDILFYVSVLDDDTGTSSSVEHTLYALFPASEDDDYEELYKSRIYLTLYNYLNYDSSKGTGVFQTSIPQDGTDGLSDDYDDFYEVSESYNYVKDYIDDVIIETIAIYSYDDSQNEYVAAIIAEDAPTISYYYYEDNSYETVNSPSSNYETTTVTQNGESVTNIRIYYFGELDSTTTNRISDEDYYDYIIFAELSEFESSDNCFQFRLIQEDEWGYIDASHPTFYRYATSSNQYTIPYNTTNSLYDIYVMVDDVDSLSEDLIATYSALGFTVISKADIEADAARGQRTDTTYYETDTVIYDNCFYVSVPYIVSSNFSDGDYYFKTLFSTIFNRTASDDDVTYQNFVSLFTTDGTSGNISILYFKLPTDTTRIVYVEDLEAFQEAYPTYSYLLQVVELPDDYNENDYWAVDSTYSAYITNIDTETYPIYFKKTIVYYETLNTSDSYTDTDYVKLTVPVAEYETMDADILIPLSSYELEDGSKVIYVEVEDDSVTTVTIGSITYTAVSSDTISEQSNIYISVPSSVSESLNSIDDTSYNFYYKHETKSGDNYYKIYIIDDSEDASENEVYKNLYYTVITQSAYESESYNYVLIEEDDENYNENFTLYYKFADDLADSENSEKYFVQNEVTGENAIYVSGTGASTSELLAFMYAGYTVVTTAELENNAKFYFQVLDEDNESSYTLYYKFRSVTTEENAIYIYTDGTNSTYIPFYDTDDDYVASDYVLIEPDDPNYVAGTDLYYKIDRNTDNDVYDEDPVFTYYYYQTSASVSLSANSYYLISFYVYTNGSYELADGSTAPIEATVVIEDTSGNIETIELTEITTEGEWVQYNLFLATNSISTSTIRIYLYMGDTESILGSHLRDENGDVIYDEDDSTQLSIKSVTGVVMFDAINIIQINETDYNKRALNDQPVNTTYITDDDGDVEEIVGEDLYGNKIIVVNDDDEYAEIAELLDNRYRNFLDVWGDYSWDDMFDFDQMDEDSILNNLTFDADQEELKNGYMTYNNLWQYYISRDNLGQGNTKTIELYKQAYEDGTVSVSVVDEPTDKAVDSDEDEDEDDDDDDEDVVYVDSTFNNNNKVLKISNSSKTLSLGVVSNAITIPQNGYYKLTVWVYAKDSGAQATIKIESILSTGSSEIGTINSVSATVDACIDDYSDTPTNEYMWIPITFYIQGNVYKDQDIYLVLLAEGNSTVYFDNITIEKVTSSAYSTASSDSDTTTYVLALSTSSSILSNGISEGYFNSVADTSSTVVVDNSQPKTPSTSYWSSNSDNSTEVIAGIVATSDDYISLSDNFYDTYGISYPFNETDSYRLPTNLFAIYAPSTKTDSVTGKVAQTTNNYLIYTSSSTTLSSSSIYKITIEFYADSSFTGNMVFNIYQSSVSSSNLISSYEISSENITKGEWITLTFYVQTGTSSVSLYTELGVSDATGVCFFRHLSSSTESNYSSLEEIRDSLLGNSGTDSSNTTNIYELLAEQYVKLVDLSDTKFTVHSSESENGIYTSNDYTTELVNTSDYTVGKYGTAIASYYSSSIETTYTVTINSTTYYIKGETDDETGETTYKMYSDAYYSTEVTTIDGKEVTITPDDSTVKVTVGSTEGSVTNVNTTVYEYHFTGEYEINDSIIIEGSELDNTVSDSVLILSNSLTTDYTSVTQVKSGSLSSSSYYVLKIYVKTSAITSADGETESGLNISIPSISTYWTNIDTTTYEGETEYNGFVCYQVLISTNSDSTSSFAVNFSLGSEDSTCSGYAIIAGVELTKFSSSTDFDNYCATLDEDDNTTIKRYYGTTSSSTSSDDDDDTTDSSTSWAVFFYVFSSLLLGIVLIIAIIAIVVRKHPIKIRKKKFKETGDIIITPTKEKKKKEVSDIEVVETAKTKKKSNRKSNDESIPSSADTGIDTTDDDNSAQPTTEDNSEDSNNKDEGFV